jgi:hypothetical protein
MAEMTIEAYAETLGDWRGEAIREIDALIRKAAPKARGSIKWAQPIYEQSGPFAWMKAAKGHVSLGFWRGAELSDPQDLLDGTGTRMRHVKILSPADIKRSQFSAWVKEAVRLNETRGDPSKRK